MPHFGQLSLSRLRTCHSSLIEVAKLAIVKYDFSIRCGWRGQEDQHAAFVKGDSKLDWPRSKHNHVLESGEKQSHAFDFDPYPEGFDPYPRYSLIAGYIMGIAWQRGIIIRWGADWDDDGIITEHALRDWGHVELISPV